MDERRCRDVLARGKEEIQQVRKKCGKEEENGESRDVIKNLKNAGREKGRMNAGKKCGEKEGYKETEIGVKGITK